MSTKTGCFVYEDPSASSVTPTGTNALLVQVSRTHWKEPSGRSQPCLTKPGPLRMEFSQTQFRGWQFPESLFGSLGLRCGQVLSREFCFSCYPTAFLLLTQQLETAPPRLLGSFTTSVTEFPKMPSLFTSGYQLSFLEFSIVASVLLCMSTLLFKTTISRPLPFFPDNTLCSLWIACVFYFVDIRRLLLASVLHGNYSQERHKNPRILYLWTRPYLFTSFLKTWLCAEFWMGERSSLLFWLPASTPELQWCTGRGLDVVLLGWALEATCGDRLGLCPQPGGWEDAALCCSAILVRWWRPLIGRVLGKGVHCIEISSVVHDLSIGTLASLCFYRLNSVISFFFFFWED